MSGEREEVTDVHTRLKRIEEGVGAIAVRQDLSTQMREMEGRIVSKVEAVEKSLHGDLDGRTGLVARVTSLEAAAKSRTAIWVAVIGCVTSVLTAAAAMYFAIHFH